MTSGLRTLFDVSDEDADSKDSAWFSSLVKSAKPALYKRGDDKQQFLRDYTVWVDLARIPRRLITYMFLQNLSPEIRRELQAYEADLEGQEFDDVAKLFRDVLSTPNERLGSRVSLASRRQRDGESLSEFMSNLFHLAREIGIAAEVEKERVREVFLEGIRSVALQDRIFEDEEIFSKKDPKEVLRRAQFLEDLLNHRRRQVRATTSEAPRNLMDVSVTAAVRPPSRPCKNCQKMGHRFQNCLELRKCFVCSSTTHLARDCPTKNSPVATDQGNESGGLLVVANPRQ